MASAQRTVEGFIGHLALVVVFVVVCMCFVWLCIPEGYRYTPEPTPLTQEEYVDRLTELQDNVIKLKKELIELQELKLLELEGKAFIL